MSAMQIHRYESYPTSYSCTITSRARAVINFLMGVIDISVSWCQCFVGWLSGTKQFGSPSAKSLISVSLVLSVSHQSVHLTAQGLGLISTVKLHCHHGYSEHELRLTERNYTCLIIGALWDWRRLGHAC